MSKEIKEEKLKKKEIIKEEKIKKDKLIKEEKLKQDILIKEEKFQKDKIVIEHLFTDIEQGFVSSKKAYKKLKAIDSDIKYTDVKKLYEARPENEVLKARKKEKFLFNTITAGYPGDVYELDIIVYDRYQQNKQKYIIVMMDVYSRYAEVRAMSSRKMSMIIKNCVEILQDMGSPYKIKADNEFNKPEFIKLMEELDIKTSFSQADEIHKNPIVERFNKTIALLMSKVRLATKNYRWPSYLQQVTKNYNNTYHDTIMQTPEEVWNGEEFNEQRVIRVESDLKVGDNVRIILKKKLFDKGDVITHSTEVYVITEAKGIKYKLNDGTDKYYKYYELEKTQSKPTEEPIKKIVEKKEIKKEEPQELRRSGRERKVNSKYVD